LWTVTILLREHASAFRRFAEVARRHGNIQMAARYEVQAGDRDHDAAALDDYLSQQQEPHALAVVGRT